MSRLIEQLEETLAALRSQGVEPALIGGLALAAHGVVRSTSDIDLLLDGNDGERAHVVLTSLGYATLYRTENVANYARGAAERLDVLYARRPIARELLAEAPARAIEDSTVRVVDVEGMIGFKLQALANDPRRTRDLDDIRALLKAHASTVDWTRLTAYFRLFDREPLLADLRRTLP